MRLEGRIRFERVRVICVGLHRVHTCFVDVSHVIVCRADDRPRRGFYGIELGNAVLHGFGALSHKESGNHNWMRAWLWVRWIGGYLVTSGLF